ETSAATRVSTSQAPRRRPRSLRTSSALSSPDVGDPMASRWLYKYSGGGPFAWTSNEKDFWLAAGGAWWGWRSGDWVYAAHGGEALGWFSSNTFYEKGSGRALYYFG